MKKAVFLVLPLVLARFGCELYEELIVLCEILFCRRDLRRFLTERSRHSNNKHQECAKQECRP